MQIVNLVSVMHAYESLDQTAFEQYLHCFGVDKLKPHEMESLKSFVQNIKKYLLSEGDDTYRMTSLDGYYVGYRIPQIGKEFDLLRFGVAHTVNIELKTEADEAKILRQLSRNRYYLNFLNRDILYFTYVSGENKLYRLVDGKDRITEVDFQELTTVLQADHADRSTAIDTLFNPSDYLVSPFNSTDRFVASEYFLTEQQEEIKKKILTWFDSKGSDFVSVTGAAGTGKTLLIYDIAKELLQQQHRVLIIHCGNLNQGQQQLNADHDWDIDRAREGYARDFADFDLIVVDEVQRIYLHQLTGIIDKVKSAGKKCIFAYDGKQCLSTDEINRSNVDRINGISTKVFRLTDKIRTNKEIADFIKQLLDRKMNLAKHDYPNVEISYFNDYADARSQLEHLRESGWKVINYTPGVKSKTYYYEKLYNIGKTYDTPHSVIGQEFDDVVGVIDEYFFYNDAGKLAEQIPASMSKYYSQYGMLYQILTRTRKRVHLVIIRNTQVLERCVTILNQ